MRYLLLSILFLLPFSVHAEKITVVASFSILGDMVHEVAGDKVILKTLVGPGSDAHVYEPTPADAKIIAGANLLIINGLGFEGWLNRLVSSSGYKGTLAVASNDITVLTTSAGTDPHAWQDLSNGKHYVINILHALCNADPNNAATYTANAAAYIRKLTKLDQWVRSEITRVPEKKRRAILPHDALHYFADAYGITFIAPLGFSTAGDATAQSIARLIDVIRAQNAHVVFTENMGDPRLMQQLIHDAGAIAGGTLYSDSLSEAGGEAASYIALFQHNTTALIEALLKN